MAVAKLICPECEAVLRPAKPVEPGKRVKCPKCGNIFAALADEDEPPPRRAPAKARKAPPDKQKKQPRPIQDLGPGTYGVVRDTDEEEKELKAERGDDMVARYLKAAKSKDPRGPAQDMITRPTNWLLITGAIGSIGWLLLLLIYYIPMLMPVRDPDEVEDGKKNVLKIQAIDKGVSAVGDFNDPTAAADAAKKKDAELRIVFIPTNFFLSLPWYVQVLLAIPMLLGIGYGCIIIFGAVRSQNLESRGWGQAAAIMAMVPYNAIGLMVLTTVVLSFVLVGVLGFSLTDDSDRAYVQMVTGILAVVQVAWGVSIGIRNLKVLSDAVVVEGFTFVPDRDSADAADDDEYV